MTKSELKKRLDELNRKIREIEKKKGEAEQAAGNLAQNRNKACAQERERAETAQSYQEKACGDAQKTRSELDALGKKLSAARHKLAQRKLRLKEIERAIKALQSPPAEVSSGETAVLPGTRLKVDARDMELLREEKQRIYREYVRRVKETDGNLELLKKASEWYRKANQDARKPEAFLKRRYDAWKRAKNTQYELEDTRKALRRAIEALTQEIDSSLSRSEYLTKRLALEAKACEEALKSARFWQERYQGCIRDQMRALREMRRRVQSMDSLLAILRHIREVLWTAPTSPEAVEYIKSTGKFYVSPEMRRLSETADMWPGLSFIKMLYDIRTGKDMVTGEPIPKVVRGLMAFFLVLSLIGLGGVGSKLARKIGNSAVVKGLVKMAGWLWKRGKGTAKGILRSIVRAYTWLKGKIFGPKLFKVKVVPIGKKLLTDKELAEHGISRLQKLWLQWVAKAEKVRIIIRGAKESSINQIRKGALPKPAYVKAKTVNEYDLFLNRALKQEHIGLVSHFQPSKLRRVRKRMKAAGIDPKSARWKEILKRREERLKNYKLFEKDYKALEKGEFRTTRDRMVTGHNRAPDRIPAGRIKVQDKTGLVTMDVVTSSGRKRVPLTGDMDLFQIVNEAGMQLGENSYLYQMVIRMLSHSPTNVLHGAHTAWKPLKKYYEMYRDIILGHGRKWKFTNGKLKPTTGDPLIMIGPKGAKIGAAVFK